MLSLEGVLSLGVWSLGGVVFRRGVALRGLLSLGSVVLSGMCPPPESEKQAVTPPTGMLSCYFNSF